MALIERKWWKESVVYQIYPASFCDSNGDGLGDLQGIISKIPYLRELGVDVIWLSPHWKSPQNDMGYDISDYKDIYEPYGTLEDMDQLIKVVHDNGLKLICDGVFNHTSDEHEWFKESRCSKTNPKRDWYIWRKGKIDKDGKKLPPNNWRSVFGTGSAWTYDEITDEWYLRLFLSSQPDLNWELPEVRAAIWDTMNFWLKKGVDGFRLDVINLIAKASGLPDAKVVEKNEEFQPSFELTASQPKVNEYLREMYDKVLKLYDCYTVGETPFLYSTDTLGGYTRGDMLSSIYHFELFDLDGGSAADPMIPAKVKLTEYKAIWAKWQKVLSEGSWVASTIGNHDQARAITRLASDDPQWRALSGKMLATMLTTMGGTTYIYEGDDFGQINMPKDWGMEEYKDPASILYVEGIREKRKKETGNANPDVSDLVPRLQAKARDNARTPMQWNSEKNAGFSTGTPWMKIHPDYVEGWNVEAQRNDPKSINRYWTKLFEMRKANLVFVYGTFAHVDFDNEDVFAYLREYEGKKALVALNFRTEPKVLKIPSDLDMSEATYLIGNFGDNKPAAGEIKLQPLESAVFML